MNQDLIVQIVFAPVFFVAATIAVGMVTLMWATLILLVLRILGPTARTRGWAASCLLRVGEFLRGGLSNRSPSRRF